MPRYLSRREIYSTNFYSPPPVWGKLLAKLQKQGRIDDEEWGKGEKFRKGRKKKSEKLRKWGNCSKLQIANKQGRILKHSRGELFFWVAIIYTPVSVKYINDVIFRYSLESLQEDSRERNKIKDQVQEDIKNDVKDDVEVRRTKRALLPEHRGWSHPTQNTKYYQELAKIIIK